VQCPHCQHDNPAQAQFCNHCGGALAGECGQCGHSNPAGARFCNQCGHSLQDMTAPRTPAAGRDSYTPRHLAERILTSRSALEGERKRVTVLFIDIKGSTDLAQQAGDEAWHQILDRFFAILTHGVHRYEGTINQYTGDGIMALFGAPVAHEDHARRACMAALELQTELRRFADELRFDKGLNLSVRFGLNSGEVVVGSIGDDLRMDYTAKGQTVNLAARMEQIAEPGRIYLTRYTAAQVEGYFRLRDLGSMNVKGIAEPVSVYELEGVGKLKTRLDMSRSRGLSSFVGRGNELQLLQDALLDVTGGHGQVAAVVGNAGIGKSRLCFEFVERARSQGVEVFQGTCVPYASTVPLHPVLDLVRGFFGIEEADSAAEQRRKIAGTLTLMNLDCRDSMQLLFEYLGVAAPGEAASTIAPEMRQQELFSMLGKLLPGTAAQPRVILLEDLHWLDEISEQFVAGLAAELEGTATLLLLNYRPDYVADWLMTGLDLDIAVTALSAEEVASLVAELLGRDGSLAALTEQIRQLAGGNPFFVEEAVRNLAELGYLEGLQGQYRLVKAVDKTVIPDSVQGILAARIDRLADDDKRLLEYAAVIGKEFGRAQLAAITEMPESHLPELLVNLEEGGFVHQREQLGEYAFCHPLIQEVTYHAQLAERRAQVHAALAAYLEAELGGNTFDERALMLAHHWSRAGHALKAAEWQIHAAVWEGVMRESNGALARYRRAIEFLDRLPESAQRDKLAITARSGVLRTSAIVRAPVEEISRVYEEGLALAKKTGDQLALAELQIAHASVELQHGDADLAVEQAHEALQLARNLGQSELIARFRVPILLTYFASGRLVEGMGALTEPGREAWFAGPMTEDNFLSRGLRALMLTYMGKLNEARRETRRAIEIEGESGRTVSWMHANLVDVARVSGHKEDAMREALAAVSRTEHFTSPFFKALAYRSLAVAHGLNDNWRQSAEILEEHLELVRPGAPAHQFEAVHLSHLAEARFHLGEIETAQAIVQEALDSARNSHSRIWECQALLVKSLILCSTGEHQAAAAQLDRLEALIAETGAVSFRPFLFLLRSQLQTDAAGRDAWLVPALQHFTEIGADGWVEQVRAKHGLETDFQAATNA